MTKPQNFPNIRYWGDCGQTGHGNAVRGYIEALETIGYTPDDIVVVPWPPAIEPVNDELHNKYLRSREYPRMDNKTVNIVHVHPPDVGLHWTAGWYNVALVTWETSKLPEGTFKDADQQQRTVVQSLNKYDEVWVPVQRVKELFEKSGVTVPVFVIPHALRKPMLERPTKTKSPRIAPKLAPSLGPPAYRDAEPVRFYYIGSWDDRKNAAAVLRAYFSTGWTIGDAVELVMHCVPSTIDRAAQEQADWIVQAAFRNAKEALPDPLSAPATAMSTSQRGYEWVCKLHEQSHVFVTAARGEGFCLPMAEALAYGNYVIAPDSPAFEHFDDARHEGSWISLSCREQEILPMPGVVGYELGQSWWDPEFSALVESFKTARELMTEVGLPLEGSKWRERLSPKEIGAFVRERLKAITKELQSREW